MQALSTDIVGQACKVFLALAYPDGLHTIPAQRQCLLDLPQGMAMVDFATQEAAAKTWCQALGTAGTANILLIRLGCAHYPHLKLKIQQLEGPGSEPEAWIFGVDTHDAFSATHFFPPPDHPDAAAWNAMQRANAALKEKIEAALTDAGFLTFNGLLQRQLDNPPAPGGAL
jgi:hypothetical protein